MPILSLRLLDRLLKVDALGWVGTERVTQQKERELIRDEMKSITGGITSLSSVVCIFHSMKSWSANWRLVL